MSKFTVAERLDLERAVAHALGFTNVWFNDDNSMVSDQGHLPAYTLDNDACFSLMVQHRLNPMFSSEKVAEQYIIPVLMQPSIMVADFDNAEHAFRVAICKALVHKLSK